MHPSVQRGGWWIPYYHHFTPGIRSSQPWLYVSSVRSSALARIDPVLCAKNDPPRPREERQPTPRFAARQTRSRGRRRQPGRSNRFPHAGSRPWKVRALKRGTSREVPQVDVEYLAFIAVDLELTDFIGCFPCIAENISDADSDSHRQRCLRAVPSCR